jgi:hypothetical protein
VYSFGVVLWECVARKLPYADMNGWQVSLPTRQTLPSLFTAGTKFADVSAGFSGRSFGNTGSFSGDFARSKFSKLA